jgi:hypothetical protein
VSPRTSPRHGHNTTSPRSNGSGIAEQKASPSSLSSNAMGQQLPPPSIVSKSSTGAMASQATSIPEKRASPDTPNAQNPMDLKLPRTESGSSFSSLPSRANIPQRIEEEDEPN